MSPEHVTGRPDDILPQSDVWSLGASLYYLLTGRLPFGAGDFETVSERIRTSDAVPPRAIAPGISAGLDAVIRDAMRRPIEERTATAAQFAEQLRACHAGLVTRRS